jgi:hypothetical protein
MLLTEHPRKAEQVKIGVNGAYTLWRSLVDRYVFIDHFNQQKNYTHDQDFLLYLTQIISDFKEEAANIEKLCSEFSIPSPRPSAKDQNVAGNSEVVKDKETAEVVFRFIRLDLNIQLLGLKASFINDDVKAFLLKLTKNAMERVDKEVKGEEGSWEKL